ncbi:uncharacterized protein STEHIDRAFT_108206 [Stereum hirsutum FP-91666 SS1]|uniref:uncharacterized protein n=1 Tax=Stereum hirsutum (strain FP-91666) TaxID=721885 RepID=UPI00044104B1|nr:uncharacterized protein STEHIDRAFT_108206 [Stereum hirsutum FP-91666 SS1]EIM89479.1 hypothetical protein STEHIDRAFT_108206 [Stereum hirsutum FP-91666 SS1]
MSPEPFVRYLLGQVRLDDCACGVACVCSTSPTAPVEDVEEGDVIRSVLHGRWSSWMGGQSKLYNVDVVLDGGFLDTDGAACHEGCHGLYDGYYGQCYSSGNVVCSWSELDNDNRYNEDDEEWVDSSVSLPTPQSRSPLEGAADEVEASLDAESVETSDGIVTCPCPWFGRPIPYIESIIGFGASLPISSAPFTLDGIVVPLSPPPMHLSIQPPLPHTLLPILLPIPIVPVVDLFTYHGISHLLRLRGPLMETWLNGEADGRIATYWAQVGIVFIGD